MKILFFNTLYYPNIVGGAEKSVQLLAERLVKKGLEVVVVSTAKEDRIDYVNGVKVYYLKHRNLYWAIDSKKKKSYQKAIWHSLDNYNFFMKEEIERIIDNEKPDVIHTNNLVGLSVIPWICAQKKGVPVVHTLRDFSLMCSKGTMFKKGRNCKVRCLDCKILSDYKRILTNKGFVQFLVGNSQFMIDRHKSLGFFSNVPSKRIFNGVTILKKNNENYNSQSEQINDISKSDKLKFFYMGRIEETKGVKLLLDTFKDLTTAELYLAGKIYDYDIKKNIENNKYPSNIKFLGYINPESILPQIDILIAPSLWHEPLPRVILEAYSFQKPVIGSTRGGIPECIRDGETGFLFDPEDKESLKKIVMNLVNKPEIINSMSSNIDRYLGNFDIEISVNQYIEVYNKLCKI